MGLLIMAIISVIIYAEIVTRPTNILEVVITHGFGLWLF